MTEHIYFHALNLLPQAGPARLYRLCEHFGAAEAAWRASAGDLAAAGFEPDFVSLLEDHRRRTDAEAEFGKLEAEGIRLLAYRDADYPKLLLEIPKLPPVLYYRGTMAVQDELCVAVVGTRKITNYGRSVAPYLVGPLIDAGVTVVSGLAYGVDSMVQQLAMQKGRRTVAVLGGGLDRKSFYPKEHQLLGDQIVDAGGALLSEYPMGTPPLKHHFIARNRIIAGMSLGTLVVECSLKSGSLITAQYALEQNRAVYAVPGPVYAEQSKGPNNLVKMGARLVTEAGDILDDLNIARRPDELKVQQLFGDNPAETALLGIVGFEPLAVDDIIKQSGLDAQTVTAALTFLEMKGKVRNVGGQQYILSR